MMSPITVIALGLGMIVLCAALNLANRLRNGELVLIKNSGLQIAIEVGFWIGIALISTGLIMLSRNQPPASSFAMNGFSQMNST